MFTYSVILSLFFLLYSRATKLGLYERKYGNPIQSNYGDRPYGVSVIAEPLYRTGENFTCIDGSKVISFKHVNDDYCDCLDGSDEPGTSACPFGSFHCLNRGHEEAIIPSSRINDQICDCCDGSDEWDGAVICDDICAKLGAKKRVEDEQRLLITIKGYAKRLELAEEGKNMKDDKEKLLQHLKQEIEVLSASKSELATRKALMEEEENASKAAAEAEWEETNVAIKREEAKSFFRIVDVNNDSVLALDELKAFNILASDDNGEISDSDRKVYFEEGVETMDFNAFYAKFDIMKYRFKDLEAVNDTDKNSSDERDSLEVKLNDDIFKEEQIGSQEDGVAKEVDQVVDLAQSDEETVLGAHYSNETLALIAAADVVRREFNEISEKIESLNSEIKHVSSFTKDDFGADLAWLPLKSECLELTESPYIYKLCLFDNASQINTLGRYSSIDLGKWKRWSSEQNGFGDHLYENGEPCWNGPERSVKVTVKCSDEIKLIEVNEPSKCEYHFVIYSPASCPDPVNLESSRNEL